MSFEGYPVTGSPEFYYAVVEASDDNRAWSAPIWINHPRNYGDDSTVVFVWTKSSRSKVYHKICCKTANRINEMNKVTGPIPPTGRRLHSCKISEGSEE